MIQTLQSIIQNYGQNVLLDGHKLLAMYSDIAPMQKRERQMLEYLVKCNGHTVLLNALHSSKEEQTQVMRKLVEKMVDQVLVSEDIAQEICCIFWEAIEGPHIELQKKDTKAAAAINVPQKSKIQVSKVALDSNRVKFTIGILATVVVLIVIIAGMMTSPQREVAKESKALIKQAEQQINDGNYVGAIDTLAQISSEWKDYNKVFAVRQEAERCILMDEIAEFEAAGNYEDLVAYLNSSVEDISSDSEIQAIYEDATRKAKANTLKIISAYTESRDYVGAIQYINLLGDSMKNDIDIKAACDGLIGCYETAAISDAEAYAQAGDYTSARSVLNTAESYIGNTSALTEKIAEIDERELTALIAYYTEMSNYEDAIICLRENNAIVAQSATLKELLNTCTEKYRSNAISKASTAYTSGGYKEATSVLTAALKVIPGDTSLNKEKAKYEACAPISLCKLDCTRQGEQVKVGTDSSKFYTDVCNNNYDGSKIHFLKYNRYHSFDDNDNDIVYYLNQGYNKFTGVIYRPYITLSCDFDWKKGGGYIEVYGDGNLLYKSPEINQNMYDTIAFDVDVSNVRELKISFYGSWTLESGEWDYKYSKICLANLEVSKVP